MKKRITVLPGDGIGPEVTRAAEKVLQVVAKKYGHDFEFQYGNIGGIAIDEEGTPLPEKTIELCKQSDAVLLGAVGGPKWDKLPASIRPEAGLLGLRKKLGLYANLRPVKVLPSLIDASPLKPEVVKGADVMVVRELTGGIYFGTPRERRKTKRGLEVVDTLHYSEQEIERILRTGFEIAQKRGKKLTSVDKANVLESSRVWREVADRVAADYPDVELSHLLVDNAAMQLIRDPKQFDVIVTENLFGDILSDEAAMLTGSIGMLPSASLGEENIALYEPVHGSAPDLAGKNKANPLATILSAAMMLTYSFQMDEEAKEIERAVERVLEAGWHTNDLYGKNSNLATTDEITEKVCDELMQEVVANGKITF